jgi:hypothetical protein
VVVTEAAVVVVVVLLELREPSAVARSGLDGSRRAIAAVTVWAAVSGGDNAAHDPASATTAIHSVSTRWWPVRRMRKSSRFRGVFAMINSGHPRWLARMTQGSAASG